MLARYPARWRFCAVVSLCVALSSLAAVVGRAAEERPDTPPKPIKLARPEYPMDQKQAGLIGKVKINFVIDEQGNVVNPVVASSNNPSFERPALDAMLQWKFSPAIKGGKPVKARAQQEITFDLQFSPMRMGPEPVISERWQVEKGRDHVKLPPALRWEKPPVPTNTAFPVYPFEALVEGKTGTARVDFIVGPDGRVVSSKLISASTPEMGRAAQAALDVWRFKPATGADGKPCGALTGLEYEFSKSEFTGVPVPTSARQILREIKKGGKAIVDLADLDAAPKPLSRRPPTYPSALRESGQEGSAEIEFYIDKVGDAQLPRIVSATSPEFGYAAAQAVASWRFEPALKNGKPVIGRAKIPVNFSLNDAKPKAPTAPAPTTAPEGEPAASAPAAAPAK